MRVLLRVLGVVCVVACATTILAGPVTDSIAFQGRLTDAADLPVADGPRDMILSFWSDSIGGSMLFSELRTVEVADGLYSTCIGCDDPSFFDIFTQDPIYLQVQLAGETPMTPRTVVRYTPRALMAARVRGDIHTESGLLRVRDNLGSSGEDGVHILADDTSSSLRVMCCLGSSGEDGVEIKMTGSLKRLRLGNIGSSGEDGVSLTDDDAGSSMQLARKRPGRVKYSNITLRALPDSVTDFRDCDSDDDGFVDTRLAISLGNGGGGGGGGSLGFGAGGSMVMTVDPDDDGDAVSEYAHRLTPTTASLAINSKGTSAKRVTAGGDCDDTDASLYTDCDDDDDGISESSVHQSSGTDGSSLTVSSRIDGTPARLSTNFTVPRTVPRSTITQGADEDGDGVDESSMVSSVERRSVSIVQRDREVSQEMRTLVGVDSTRGVISTDRDSDDDGVSEEEALMRVMPGVAYHAIKTKGTGAESNRTTIISSSAELDSAVTVSAHDDDGDGIPEQEVSTKIMPGVSYVAIKTKGTGADANRVVGTTDDSTAVMVLATDSGSITMTARKGGVIKGSININHASTMRVSLGADGNGYFATGLGVGVDPTHPIEVAGGAYCDGTDWVNASDANAKENFEEVDGEELLEKIDDLPVTRWNYKNDPDETLHIGPTAQDFQATFGVGSDGTSISTIDPSGIALAAIKALNKQNKDLKAQNADLQRQLEELKQQVGLLLQKK